MESYRNFKCIYKHLIISKSLRNVKKNTQNNRNNITNLHTGRGGRRCISMTDGRDRARRGTVVDGCGPLQTTPPTLEN